MPYVQAMPLGDSITYGSGDPAWNGYRAELYQALTGAGDAVDFVGSMASGTCADPEHEGHRGWFANQIRDNIFGWLVNTPADVVLLHVGSNDISAGQSAAGVRDEIAQILGQIDAYEQSAGAGVTVILAEIINRRDPLSDEGLETSILNGLLRDLAEARAAAGDRITAVDQESALCYPADMADTVHPNISGYKKMAGVWFSALDALLCRGPAMDLDGDCDVDGDDLLLFGSCTSGPAVPHDGTGLCQGADADGDGDVDQSDFGVFQRCLSGADVPADPTCEG